MHTEHRALRAPAMLVVALLLALVAGCAAPPVVTTEQSTPPAEPSAFPTPASPLPTTEARAHVPATKLNGPLPQDAQVAQFTVSPDGRHVVYVILAPAPPATTPPSIYPPPVPSVSPPPYSGTRHVTSHMYSVPVAGGAPVEMTASIDPPIERVARLEFSPDNQHVAFSLDANPSPLYVASLDGRMLEMTDHEYGSGVYDFAWSPDGKHLAFSVFGTFEDEQGSYSLPASGGTPIKLSDLGFVSDMSAITSDSQYLIFAGAAPNALEDNRRNSSSLYRVPVRGGAAVELVNNFTPPNTVIHIDVAGPLPFQVSPDGTTVVYASPDPDTGHFTLFKVAVTGGPPQQLTQPQTVADSVFSFHISPDSKHVVFRTGAQYVNQSPHGMPGGDVVGLQSVPLAGGSVATLSPPLPRATRLLMCKLAPIAVGRCIAPNN